VVSVRRLLFLQQQFLVGLLRLLLAGQQQLATRMRESQVRKTCALLLQHQH